MSLVCCKWEKIAICHGSSWKWEELNESNQAEIEFDKIHLLNYVLSDDEAGSKAAVLEKIRWPKKTREAEHMKRIERMFGAMWNGPSAQACCCWITYLCLFFDI